MELVTIEIEGKPDVHLPGVNGNYATLCGLDGDDPDAAVQQRTVPTKADARVNCETCRDIWRFCKNVSPKLLFPK